MEKRVAELIKEVGELRRRVKGIEGKVYKMEQENIEILKRMEMVEEESFRKVGEREGIKEVVLKRGEEIKEIRNILKNMSVKESDSEMEEGEWDDLEEKAEEEEAWRKKEWGESKKKEESKEKEEGKRDLKKRVLIVKRGERANKKVDLEKWIVKILKIKGLKIVETASNKEAAKVFFPGEREKEEVWERREELKKEEDMLVDRWLTMEERRDRYRLWEKMNKLKEEYKRKGMKLKTKLEEEETERRFGEKGRCTERRERRNERSYREGEVRRERRTEREESRRGGSRERGRACSCRHEH